MEFDPLTNTFLNDDGRIGFVDPTYWMNNMYVEQHHAQIHAQFRAGVKEEKRTELKIRKKWLRMAQAANPTNPSAAVPQGSLAVGAGMRKFKIPTVVINRAAPRSTSRGLLGMSIAGTRSRKK